MPEEEKKMVPIDTSGPDAEVDIEEKKDEAVIEQPEQEKENTEIAYSFNQYAKCFVQFQGMDRVLSA